MKMQKLISDTIKQLYNIETTPIITRPEPHFGDFSTNIALQLAGQLQTNPRQIAQNIADELQKTTIITEASVAGAGFINLKLANQYLLKLLEKTPQKPYQNQKIVFEYSCPNAFKELHTGHLYQTIYGDIVAKLMELGGAELSRTSFGGDVGLHVAKCLWGIVQNLGGEYPQKLNEIDQDIMSRTKWISQCYTQGAADFEQNEEHKKAINQLNSQIYNFHKTDQESPLAEIYWTTRQWSFDYFTAFYKLIEVENLHYYPESSTADIGMEIVAEQLQKGNLKKSENAIIFEGDPKKHLHTRVFVTASGLPTYETKDLGVIIKEQQDYNFDKRYLLTGNDQREYMRVVFAAAETFFPDLADKMTHLTTGTVKFADGQKMSSRLGNVTRAIDAIEIVRQKVAKIVDQPQIINDVTLGAVKYAFAKYKLGGDIAFNVDETVSLSGNSGPYIQYAHARACSILKKADQSAEKLNEIFEEDRLLIHKLSEYNEILNNAVHSLEPHLICNYLFELTQEFNRYYEKNQVLNDPKTTHRLAITELYATTIRDGLAILGIAAPTEM